MSRFAKYFIAGVLFCAASPVFADTSSSTVVGTPASTTPALASQSFCDRLETLTETVHADATQRTEEHKADVDKLNAQREDDKKQLANERVATREEEDAAHAALVEVLEERAKTPEEKTAVDVFASATGKFIADLRSASDKARAAYDKATRPVTLGERAKREKALSSYIDRLNDANIQAEESCAKGANDEKVMAQYDSWLKLAKENLAKSLKLKKTTLEQRARDAHLAELARLQKDYQRNMDRAMKTLSDKFPALLVSEDSSATTSSGASTDSATTTPH